MPLAEISAEAERFSFPASRGKEARFAAEAAIFSALATRALSLTFVARHWRTKIARHDYKATWNRLAFFEHDAKIGVAGLTDAAIISASPAPTFATLQSTVGIRADAVVFEIGAGIGRVGTALAPLCRKWIGADVSKHMLTHMRRRLRRLGNVEAIEISGYDLAPIASASVDVVYCTVVFMHLEEWDRDNYVLEGMRVLKPGGRMLVDNINLLSDEGWAFFETHRACRPSRRKPSISKTSTPQEQHAYFERAGFAEITQRLHGAWVITHGIKPGG